MRRTPLVFLVLVALLVAAAAAAPKPYRCMRPFEALSSFTPKAMQARDNCLFDYLHLDGANVTLHCGFNVPHGLDRQACYASVHLNLTATKALESDALPRYTVQFRSLNNSVVHYKGMDGNGYSVCCALVDGEPCDWEDEESNGGAPQEAASARAEPTEEGVEEVLVEAEVPQAQQRKRQRLVPKRCPLVRGGGEGASKVITGTIRKPLHRIIVGAWEAQVTFRVGEERVVGKVQIPFSVTRAHQTAVLDAMAPGDGEFRPGVSDEAMAKGVEKAAPARSNLAVVVPQGGNETERDGLRAKPGDEL